MTYNHPNRENSGRVVLRRRIFEVKTTLLDGRIELTNFVTRDNSNPFLSVYGSYGTNGIHSFVGGYVGEVNIGFNQLICSDSSSLMKVAAE